MSKKEDLVFGMTRDQLSSYLDSCSDREKISNSREIPENKTLLNFIKDGTDHLNKNDNVLYRNFLVAVNDFLD